MEAPHVIGALRIKNEARWIAEVIESILPLCEHVLILDDHSDDETVPICASFGKPVRVFESAFAGLDETRDRNFLLQKMMELVPTKPTDWLSGSLTSPYFGLTLDGDEVLTSGGQEVIRKFTETTQHVGKLPIRYLWNDRQHVRMDGVYATFARPSLFRLMNRAFTFQSTPWGGNFHCSSIPQELLHHAHHVLADADLLHLGYMHAEDRLRKYEWYNKIDPNNGPEDQYKHMVIGDTFPAESVFRHGGPLKIEPWPLR